MTRLAAALVCALAASAAANGRPAATSTINFRPGNEQHILAGMTFGVTKTEDGGATWRWMCEDAVRYGGMYDPDYAYSSTGAVFATTFIGLLVNRNGCTFDNSFFGEGKFVSSVTRGPDGAIFAGMVHPPDPAASDPGDSKIYKSTDDGETFSISAAPAPVGTWWSSIEVAPSDAQRVYATGYRLIPEGRAFELHRSNDGGATWAPMAMTGLTTTRNSTIDIVSVSRTNPDHVYLRISFQEENAISDAIFRTTNGGTTWAKIYDKPAELSFVARANGDLVVGDREADVRVARNPGTGTVTWEALVDPPTVNCLVENTAGEVWACTQNFNIPQVPSDDAGIMKSTDLVTWTKVLRFQEIAGPVECAPGTLQHDKCVVGPPSQWCSIRQMFGIPHNPTSCVEQPLFDAPPSGDVTTVDVPPKDGCCNSSAAPKTSSLAIGALVGMVLLRRRRRTTTC